jgi:antitoxin FitA
MPVNLSIKNAPDELVRAIIKAAILEDRRATPAEVLAEVRRLGLRSPSEAAALVRTDRDDH